MKYVNIISKQNDFFRKIYNFCLFFYLLKALKNERREANKRRRSSGPLSGTPGVPGTPGLGLGLLGGLGPGGGGSSGNNADNSSDTSSNDTSEFYHSPSPGPPSAKKQRVLFSEEQKEALKLAFQLDSYPNLATIEYLANELNLNSRTVSNWYHNHRMRLKQQPEQQQQLQSRENQNFDPIQFRMLLNQRLIELSKERVSNFTPNLPIHYPNYFNNNFSSLMNRVLPEKEQFNGLDLTIVKREFDDESNISEDSNVSSLDDASSTHQTKKDTSTTSSSVPQTQTAGRSSRRKATVPQWVNPKWEENLDTREKTVINGVCILQTGDLLNSSNDDSTTTVHIEPVEPMEHYSASEEDHEETNNDEDEEHQQKSTDQTNKMMTDDDEEEDKDPISQNDAPATPKDKSWTSIENSKVEVKIEQGNDWEF